MDCPNCSTPHSESARFCSRCGTSLHRGIDRQQHFAAMPDEPVRVSALMSTLMPHLSGARLYVYRDLIGLALLASLISASFGVLSLALIFAAVALPVAVLTYIEDHDVWKGDPLTSIGLGLIVSLTLGVGVGVLQAYFAMSPVLASPARRLPSVNTILELGVLVPVVAFIAVLIVPLIVTSRQRMRNAVDTMVICTLSGAALSLGMSVVIQRGAFIDVVQADPAQVAFIAVNLGLLQAIILGTAAAVSVMAIRRKDANTFLGLGEGVLLVVLYELATTLLTPYGARGVVLTTVVGLVLAACGLVAARVQMHTALLAEAQGAIGGGQALAHAPTADRNCAHCGAAISSGAAFCQACGTATAALGRRTAATAASGKQSA